MAQTQDVQVRLKLALDGLPEATKQVLELASAAGQADKRLRDLESIAGRRRALADGSYTQGVRADQDAARLGRETGFAERRAAVADGTFARGLAQQRDLHRQELETRLLERRAELQSLYGRTGGNVAHGLERLGENRLARLGGGLALGAAGAVAAATTSGMSGTVEGNRLAMELSLLNREIAGALRPAILFLTDSIRSVRQWFQRQGRTTQNAIMAGTIGTLGLAAAGSLSRNVLGMGLAQVAGAGISRVAGVGGIGAAIANALPFAAARFSPTAVPGVMPGGAVMPAPPGRRRFPKGAKSAAAIAALLAAGMLTEQEDPNGNGSLVDQYRKAGHSEWGANVRGAMSASSEFLGLDELGKSLGFETTRDRLTRQADPNIKEGQEKETYYKLYREAGGSKIGSGLRSLLSGASEALYLDDIGGALGFEKTRDRLRGEKVRDLPQNEKDKDDRNSLTLAGGGFGELGSSYDRFVMAADQIAESKDERRNNLLEKIEENTRKDVATPNKREE